MRPNLRFSLRNVVLVALTIALTAALLLVPGAASRAEFGNVDTGPGNANVVGTPVGGTTSDPGDTSGGSESFSFTAPGEEDALTGHYLPGGVVWFNDNGGFRGGQLPDFPGGNANGWNKCAVKVQDGPYSYNVGARWTAVFGMLTYPSMEVTVSWECIGPPGYVINTYWCPDRVTFNASSPTTGWSDTKVIDINADWKSNCRGVNARWDRVQNAFGKYRIDAEIVMKGWKVYHFTSTDKRTNSVPPDEELPGYPVETSRQSESLWQQFCGQPYWTLGWGGSRTYTLADCPPRQLRCETPKPPDFQHSTPSGSTVWRENTDGAYETMPDGRYRTIRWPGPIELRGSRLVAGSTHWLWGRFNVAAAELGDPETSSPLRQRGNGQSPFAWMNSDTQYFDGKTTHTETPFNTTLSGEQSETARVRVRFFRGSDPTLTSVQPWILSPSWRMEATVRQRVPDGFVINWFSGDLAVDGRRDVNITDERTCAHAPARVGVMSSRLQPN